MAQGRAHSTHRDVPGSGSPLASLQQLLQMLCHGQQLLQAALRVLCKLKWMTPSRNQVGSQMNIDFSATSTMPGMRKSRSKEYCKSQWQVLRCKLMM